MDGFGLSVGWALRRPVRPYRNIAEFRDSLVKHYSREAFFLENSDRWPCIECRGVGKILDSNDPPEYGGRWGRITCPKCRGSRCCTREQFAAEYHRIIARYLKKKREYEALAKAQRTALEKLTPIELTALNTLGLVRQPVRRGIPRGDRRGS